MKNKKIIYGILVIVVLAMTGVGLFMYLDKLTTPSVPTIPILPTKPKEEVGLPNPASVYCKEQGGKLEIRKEEKGDKYGVCVFSDGSECEEWAFFRRECKPLSEKKEGFCGWSTLGKCLTDLDCTKGGCSGQICQSKQEEPIITTCEWIDCYDAKAYKMECKCVNKQCQWYK